MGSPLLNQSLDKFKIKTPGIYGPSIWTLVGLFTWIVGTGALGAGLALTAAIYMGMGIGTVNFDSLLVFGLELSTLVHKFTNVFSSSSLQLAGIFNANFFQQGIFGDRFIYP